MIASLQGRVAAIYNDYVIVTVGGVGLQVFAPFSTLERIKSDEVFLYTELIVREDSLTLYGFFTIPERDLFNTLLKVSGIGPKMAITILSNITVDNLRSAVVSERAELLTRVPGIGKKTAEKIVFELKRKLPVGLEDAPIGSFDDVNNDVMDALTALGYSIVEAQTAIQSLPKDAPQDIEERIRLALQYFS